MMTKPRWMQWSTPTSFSFAVASSRKISENDISQSHTDCRFDFVAATSFTSWFMLSPFAQSAINISFITDTAWRPVNGTNVSVLFQADYKATGFHTNFSVSPLHLLKWNDCCWQALLETWNSSVPLQEMNGTSHAIHVTIIVFLSVFFEQGNTFGTVVEIVDFNCHDVMYSPNSCHCEALWARQVSCMDDAGNNLCETLILEL